jgi:hypothetical protein
LQKTERWEKTGLPDTAFSRPLPVCTARFQRALLFLGYILQARRLIQHGNAHRSRGPKERKRDSLTLPRCRHFVAAKAECPEISDLLRHGPGHPRDRKYADFRGERAERL